MTTERQALKQIEQHVTAARELIEEAKKIAINNGLAFSVDIRADLKEPPDPETESFESSEEWDDSGCTS